MSDQEKKYVPFFEQLKDRTPTPDSFQVKNSLTVLLEEIKDPSVKESVLKNLQTKDKTEMGFTQCQLLFYFKEGKATIKLYDERQKVPVMDISLKALQSFVQG